MAPGIPENEDGMLARWYLLLGQFSVTFEYHPGAQHANADGMSRQCGQCQRPDCPVSAIDSPVPDVEPEAGLVDQHFASSDADLLPELSGETWVAPDLLPVGANLDLITASRQDATLTTVRAVGLYSGMGGVCRTFSGATLLAVTSGQLVH